MRMGGGTRLVSVWCSVPIAVKVAKLPSMPAIAAPSLTAKTLHNNFQ